MVWSIARCPSSTPTCEPARTAPQFWLFMRVVLVRSVGSASPPSDGAVQPRLQSRGEKCSTSNSTHSPSAVTVPVDSCVQTSVVSL